MKFEWKYNIIHTKNEAKTSPANWWPFCLGPDNLAMLSFMHVHCFLYSAVSISHAMFRPSCPANRDDYIPLCHVWYHDTRTAIKSGSTKYLLLTFPFDHITSEERSLTPTRCKILYKKSSKMIGNYYTRDI